MSMIRDTYGRTHKVTVVITREYEVLLDASDKDYTDAELGAQAITAIRYEFSGVSYDVVNVAVTKVEGI